MICPNCGCHDRVMRTVTKGEEVYRLRRCIKCGHTSRTEEKRLGQEAEKPAPVKKSKSKSKPKPKPQQSKPAGTLEAALAAAE